MNNFLPNKEREERFYNLFGFNRERLLDYYNSVNEYVFPDMMASYILNRAMNFDGEKYSAITLDLTSIADTSEDLAKLVFYFVDTLSYLTNTPLYIRAPKGFKRKLSRQQKKRCLIVNNKKYQVLVKKKDSLSFDYGCEDNPSADNDKPRLFQDFYEEDLLFLIEKYTEGGVIS